MGLLGPLEKIGQSIGLNDLPIVGSTGLFGKTSEQQQLEQAFKQAQQQQQAYRPYAAQANQQALGQITSLFGPISKALQSMYGTGYGLDTSGIQQSPISPQMLALGNPNAPQRPGQVGGQGQGQQGGGGPLSIIKPWFA